MAIQQSFQQIVLEQLEIYMQKLILNIHLTLYTKINSKWITDVNVKMQNCNKFREKFSWPRVGKVLPSNAWSIKIKNGPTGLHQNTTALLWERNSDELPTERKYLQFTYLKKDLYLEYTKNTNNLVRSSPFLNRAEGVRRHFTDPVDDSSDK